MYAATRLFASNLNPKMAQRFFNLVLLDSVRAGMYVMHHASLEYFTHLACFHFQTNTRVRCI